MKFEKNVGMVDRIVRIAIGFVVIGVGAKYLAAPLNLLVAFIGFIFAATGAIGVCSLYSILGVNTVGKPCCDTCSCETEIKPKRKSKKVK